MRPFDQDVERHGGYVYTTNARLSSRLANERLTRATLELADWRAKRVIDIGCGDGTYTMELLERGRPATIHGIDPAETAIAAARAKVTDGSVSFAVASAYDLPDAEAAYDIAYLRGVLHHMDRPVDALREALRVARTIVVIEPNGYSPGLKLLERWSRYHVEHGEKSYAPRRLDRWVEELGASVIDRRWVGFVPMFSPDPLARAMKRVEPAVERLPAIRLAACAVYAFAAARAG